MLQVGVLQSGLSGLCDMPDATSAGAAKRFADVIHGWASGATAMGVPAVLPPRGLVEAGVMAGEKVSLILAKFWPAVIFPGMTSPPVGPMMIEPLVVPIANGATAAAILAAAMQANALMQMVSFVVGGVPVVFPVM